MYAQIKNGAVVAYPLNEHAIRNRFPNASLPNDLANNLPEGYVKVVPGVKPIQTDRIIITESTPELVGDNWTQTFTVTQKYSPEELEQLQADELENKWLQFRGQRDALLAESDHVIYRHKEQKELGMPTSITDIEYMAWLTYRQQLRDLPESTQHPDHVTWPNIPGELGVSR